jgi:hypothetical protein
MKVRLAEGLQLIITPESYVEHVALVKWNETHQGAGGLLVEAYAQQSAHPTPESGGTLPTVESNSENTTPTVGG